MIEEFIEKIDLYMVKNRESLLELDKVVLEDCKALAKLCLETDDKALLQIRLYDLTLKMTVFFTGKTDVSPIKKQEKSESCI